MHKFQFKGCIILGFVVVLAVVTRSYITTIMQRANVDLTPNGYIKFLRVSQLANN